MVGCQIVMVSSLWLCCGSCGVVVEIFPRSRCGGCGSGRGRGACVVMVTVGGEGLRVGGVLGRVWAGRRVDRMDGWMVGWMWCKNFPQGRVGGPWGGRAARRMVTSGRGWLGTRGQSDGSGVGCSAPRDERCLYLMKHRGGWVGGGVKDWGRNDGVMTCHTACVY